MTTSLPNSLKWSLVILSSFLFHFAFSQAPPPLPSAQKAAVDKLREAVGSQLTAQHMKSDAYLIKWLKAQKFDHDKAVEALEKTLKWRKEVDADNLPFGDYSDLSKQYVLDFTTTRDRLGRPIVLIPWGEWDLRKKAIQGKASHLLKYLDFLDENAAQLAYNYTGDPTSYFIMDLAGFSLRKSACIACIPIYLNWVRTHELHYPYNVYGVIAINAPKIFDPILKLSRGLMTESTRDAVKVYGYDRTEWSNVIRQSVDPQELPYRFGGNIKKPSST